METPIASSDFIGKWRNKESDGQNSFQTLIFSKSKGIKVQVSGYSGTNLDNLNTTAQSPSQLSTEPFKHPFEPSIQFDEVKFDLQDKDILKMSFRVSFGNERHLNIVNKFVKY